MANISISDLNPVGSALFSDSEGFMDTIRDLSEDELKISGGHGKYKNNSKSYSKNKSYSKSYSKNKSKKNKKNNYYYGY